MTIPKLNTISYKLFEGKWFIEQFRYKFIRKIVARPVAFITRLKVESMMDKWSLEQILYNFAEFSHVTGLTDGKIKTLFRMFNADPDEVCMKFTVLTDCRDVVDGIDMTIWTEDKMAKINLKLSVVAGSLNTNIVWAYKNEDGIFVNYNRRNSIIEARDYIKDLLIDHISKIVGFVLKL